MNCSHHRAQPDSLPLQGQRLDEVTPSSTGSRRRRLWDLPHQCHCPLVGVCLPLDSLRQLVNKALGGKTPADDYDVHVGVVAECGQRSRLSEVLQHDLERRYARTVQQFKAAKTTQAVALLWKKTVEQGDVTGALWAALTHPRCDAALQEVICRNMHMFQHHAGAHVRADLAEFNALTEENALLARELGRAQERSSRVMADKASEIERLSAQLVQARAENIGKDTRLAFLNADLAALKASLPDLEPALRLQKKIRQMALRQTELEESLCDLRQKLAAAEKARDTVNVEPSRQADTSLAEAAPLRSPGMPIYLHQKTVLCVGGRSGNVASYRDVIERVGGRFAHHDGGQKDSPNVLDANLTAADLVICQTGCISHNAYWKVKDFCKRTGKRCVFIENPSATSLARSLEQIAVKDGETLVPENSGLTPG
jgi:hypothetical protein